MHTEKIVLSSSRHVALPQNDVHAGGVWKKSRCETCSLFPCDILLFFHPHSGSFPRQVAGSLPAWSGSSASPVLIFQLPAPSYSASRSCTTQSPLLIFPLPTYSAYGVGATIHSPVLIFQPSTYSAYCISALPSRQFSSSSLQRLCRLKLYYNVASSHLPAPQILRDHESVLSKATRRLVGCHR